MTRDTRFDWMNECCFEPRERAFEQPSTSRFPRIFLSLAIIAIATGILLAI